MWGIHLLSNQIRYVRAHAAIIQWNIVLVSWHVYLPRFQNTNQVASQHLFVDCALQYNNEQLPTLSTFNFAKLKPVCSGHVNSSSNSITKCIGALLSPTMCERCHSGKILTEMPLSTVGKFQEKHSKTGAALGIPSNRTHALRTNWLVFCNCNVCPKVMKH